MPAFTQSREAVVDAPVATLHALIDDLERWQAWSPWEGADPDLQRTYSTPSKGVGAHYSWSGNKKAGHGRMEITSSAPERIALDLEFIAPFKASNKVIFTLAPAGEGTRVIWTMTGRRNVVFAVMGALFFDRAIGKDFDRGLASMKTLAEA